MRLKSLSLAVFASAVFAFFLLAAPAGAVGPYCDTYCSCSRSCDDGCWVSGGLPEYLGGGLEKEDDGSTESLYYTNCGDWGLCVSSYSCNPPTNYCSCTCTNSYTGSGDTIYGDSSNNCLCGGGGADTIYGDAGGDKLRGDSGNDTLYGGSGDDCLDGGSGSDHLDGQTGTDSCYNGETYVSCP